MSITDILWQEKYRPKSLGDLALTPENRTFFQGCIDAQEMPHLLLHGPAGCGKTTIAKILTAAIPSTVLTLNASSERGIDVVREKIGTFARAIFQDNLNVVFLDEGDRLTADAQTALRNMMETYANRTRFIITANYLYRIIDPIQSRCTSIEMGQVPFKERCRVLKTILEKEQVVYELADLLQYAESYTDLRRLVTAAQHTVMSSGTRTLTPLSSQPHGGEQVWDLVTKKSWKALVALSRQANFDHQAALRSLFWAIPQEHPKAASLRVIVSKAVHESTWTVDVVVQFLGTCAEMMEAL